MGAGADAGKCSGNFALAARNGEAGCMAENFAVVIFTSAISDQGCAFRCRDSPIYLLAMRTRFSGRVLHPRQAGPTSKPSSGADWPDHDQFAVRFLPDLLSAALPKYDWEYVSSLALRRAARTEGLRPRQGSRQPELGSKGRHAGAFGAMASLKK